MLRWKLVNGPERMVLAQGGTRCPARAEVHAAALLMGTRGVRGSRMQASAGQCVRTTLQWFLVCGQLAMVSTLQFLRN